MFSNCIRIFLFIFLVTVHCNRKFASKYLILAHRGSLNETSLAKLESYISEINKKLGLSIGWLHTRSDYYLKVPTSIGSLLQSQMSYENLPAFTRFSYVESSSQETYGSRINREAGNVLAPGQQRPWTPLLFEDTVYKVVKRNYLGERYGPILYPKKYNSFGPKGRLEIEFLNETNTPKNADFFFTEITDVNSVQCDEYFIHGHDCVSQRAQLRTLNHLPDVNLMFYSYTQINRLDLFVYYEKHYAGSWLIVSQNKPDGIEMNLFWDYVNWQHVGLPYKPPPLCIGSLIFSNSEIMINVFDIRSENAFVTTEKQILVSNSLVYKPFVNFTYSISSLDGTDDYYNRAKEFFESLLKWKNTASWFSKNILKLSLIDDMYKQSYIIPELSTCSIFTQLFHILEMESSVQLYLHAQATVQGITKERMLSLDEFSPFFNFTNTVNTNICKSCIEVTIDSIMQNLTVKKHDLECKDFKF